MEGLLGGEVSWRERGCYIVVPSPSASSLGSLWRLSMPSSQHALMSLPHASLGKENGRKAEERLTA